MKTRRNPWLWAAPAAGVAVAGLSLVWWRFGAGATGRVLLLVAWPANLAAKEWWVRARPSFSAFATTFLGGWLFFWAILWWDARWFVKGPFLALVVGPVMALANSCYRADRRRAQARRDVAASQLADAVRSGGPTRPFALYLRPFASTDRLATQALPPELGAGDEIPTHVDLETRFTRALRETYPVVALGAPGEVIEGPGRVRVDDEEWQGMVGLLAERASLLIAVPLAYEGTVWELQWVDTHGYHGKTLYVMPGVLHEAPTNVVRTWEQTDRVFDAGILRFHPSPHTLHIAEGWGRARSRAEDMGIGLPPYAATGALFTLDAVTRQPSAILPLGLTLLNRPQTYLECAIASLGLPPTPSPAAVPADGRPPPDPLDAFEAAMSRVGRTREYGLSAAADAYRVWGDAERAARLDERVARNR